jgi:general secretion pathway protein D
MKGALLGVAIGLIALLLAGCTTNQGGSREAEFNGGIFGQIFGDLDAKPTRTGARQAGGPADPTTKGPGIDVVYGEPEAGTAGSAGAAKGATGDGTPSPASEAQYRLNFDNAEISDVVKAVLGDSLGLSYTIDPGVAGRVTLSSARPVAREDLLPVLESLLRTNGAVVTQQGGIYRVVPDNGAAMASVDRTNNTPGYGISVVPLRYVSAKTIVPLMEGFGYRAGIIRVEPSRNLLLLLGNSAERKTAQ